MTLEIVTSETWTLGGPIGTGGSGWIHVISAGGRRGAYEPAFALICRLLIGFTIEGCVFRKPGRQPVGPRFHLSPFQRSTVIRQPHDHFTVTNGDDHVIFRTILWLRIEICAPTVSIFHGVAPFSAERSGLCGVRQGSSFWHRARRN